MITAKNVLRKIRRNKYLELVSSLILHSRYELMFSDTRNPCVCRPKPCARGIPSRITCTTEQISKWMFHISAG